MLPSTRLRVAKVAAILAPIIPAFIYAHSDGPPPGAAGPPSDRTCSSPGCHNPSSGGTGNVTATFANNASQYVPGMKQHIVITITDPVQRRWGFEATARPASNPRSGEAGRFDSTDGNTQIICEDGSNRAPDQSCASFEYIEHTLAGTRLGASSPVTFEFDWTPPATGVGDILFYVASNAANGDGTQFGDHIYFQTTTLHQVSSPGTPSISGVINAASGAAVIAPNGWISIFGNSLSATTRSWGPSDFVNGSLPTRLDGVGVMVDNMPAYVAYISPTQINVLAPPDTNQGPVNVQVTSSGGASNAVTVAMQPVSPGLFLLNGGNVAALHSDYSLVGPGGTPAVPGETILLFGAGCGETNPPFPPGQIIISPLPLPQTSSVTIGGAAAQTVFAGLAPGSAGVYQFNVVVPSLDAGSYPVVMSYQGGQTQSSAVLSVTGVSAPFIGK